MQFSQKMAQDGKRIGDSQAESWKATKSKLQGEEHSRFGEQHEQRDGNKEIVWD